MAPPPPPPPPLMDELVEEILLRIPPDDPARLLHAALVCKRWGRIVSDPGFRVRFREFHRTPPMLGFFRERGWSYYFISTSSFRRAPAALLDSHLPIDARHGRVLLWNLHLKCHDGGIFRQRDGGIPLGNDLMVWNPITGESSEFPLPPLSRRSVNRNAAVLCSSTDGACDHLDCARGHFLVVYVCNSKTEMFVHVYSSEAAAWSEISAQHLHVNDIYPLPSALIGNALYFVSSSTVLKYDLAAQEVFLIPLPEGCMYGRTMLRTIEGGRLGLATISIDGVRLYLWSREIGPNEDVGWTQSKVIKIRKLLPDVPLQSLRVVGFAHGLDVIFVVSNEGTFTIDLKSVRATKVHGGDCYSICFPYMSFYTPALGAASAERSRIAE